VAALLEADADAQALDLPGNSAVKSTAQRTWSFDVIRIVLAAGALTVCSRRGGGLVVIVDAHDWRCRTALGIARL
jgi:hypothetical protein